MFLWMVALAGTSPPNDSALSCATEETCVQQGCGVSGIDGLNSARGRELVVNAGDGSAHPDRRVLLIANANGIARSRLALYTRRLWVDQRVDGRRRRRLVSRRLALAIAGVLRAVLHYPLRLTVLEFGAFLTATHR
jgi:hypothetical protein